MQYQIDYLDYEQDFPHTFRSRYQDKLPCIVRGCVEKWPAAAWNIDHLRSLSYPQEDTGNLNFVIIQDPVNLEWYPCSRSRFPKIRAKLRNIPLVYQPMEWVFPLRHPDLIQEIDIPPLLRNGNWLNLIPQKIKPVYPRLLLGYEGTGSHLHIDVAYTASWMALVEGTKKWLVMPYTEANNLAAYINYFTSDTQIIKEKVSSYYEFNLSAGELVYIPGKWWHQVYNLEDTIALTYNIFKPHQALSYALDALITYYEQKAAEKSQEKPELICP
jgi:hypothetical protein